MGYNMKLDTVTMAVDIEEVGDHENRTVNFVVRDLGDTKIELSNSNVDDIKNFYDIIFEFIILEETLINFSIDSDRSNLYFDVARDIIEHLNNEIKQSEDNFVKLIELKK